MKKNLLTIAIMLTIILVSTTLITIVFIFPIFALGIGIGFILFLAGWVLWQISENIAEDILK